MNTSFKDYKILGRFIHGSENSIDLDVMYQFDKMPTPAECKEFCSADSTENRNIFVIGENGTMSDCYKGSVDETNNVLLFTYKLHEQEYELPVKKNKERSIFLKIVRSSRVILSHLSRSQYRDEIKEALRSSWSKRIDVLKEINLCKVDFSSFTKNMSKEDVIKTIVFQLGQVEALIYGQEVFTKNEVIEYNDFFKKFLNREELEDSDIVLLNSFYHRYIYLVSSLRYKDISDDEVLFNLRVFNNENDGIFINLRTEKLISK